MRLLRPQFTLRLAMSLIAAFALTLAVLMRPYPVMIIGIGATGYVQWSDGTFASMETSPRLAGLRRYGPLIQIKWSDGSQAWRIRRSATNRLR